MCGAAFFYDVACPFSYLVAERVERVLGEVEWVPAPAVGLDGGARWARFEATRELAERARAAARLPLVWPDGFPANTRHALRAASYAAENGAGASFALAASGSRSAAASTSRIPRSSGSPPPSAGLSVDGMPGGSARPRARSRRCGPPRGGFAPAGCGACRRSGWAGRFIEGDRILIEGAALARRAHAL